MTSSSLSSDCYWRDDLETICQCPQASRCRKPSRAPRRTCMPIDSFDLLKFVLRKQHVRPENQRLRQKPAIPQRVMPALRDVPLAAPSPRKATLPPRMELNRGDLPPRLMSPIMSGWRSPTYVEVNADIAEDFDDGPTNFAEEGSWLDCLAQLERLSTKELLSGMHSTLVTLTQKETDRLPLTDSRVRSFGTFSPIPQTA